MTVLPLNPLITKPGPDHRFGNDTRGNVTMMAALLLVPLLTVAGFAIDFQLVTTKKTQVQFALDSSVIAGARDKQSGSDEAEITQTIQTYINALADSNGGGLSCDPASVVFAEDTQDITAMVLCSQPTTLSVLFGKTHLDFRVSSTSTYGIGKLDVAFVFDSSGSMGGSKLTSLREAAALAVEELIPDGSNNNGDIRIAMTAYNQMVNAGSYMGNVVESLTFQDSWYTLDGSLGCPYVGQDSYGRSWYQCTGMVTIDHTCVFEREGTEAFTAATPGNNDWLIAGGLNEDNCPPSEPLPLTTDKATLLDYAADLTASGGTAGHQGVAWGWYLIAPEWAGIWPAESEPLAYDEPDSTKALILMTDGSFNRQNAGGQGSSTEQAEDLCDNIKDAGVVIYSVAFQAPAAGEAVLEYCSSGPEYFFDPTTGEELESSYRAIATSISDLRIKH